MVSLAALWLPILASAVLVFISSSIIWMALPIHKKDYSRLPREEEFIAAVKQQAGETGMYMFPWCDHKQLKNDPAMQARMKAGPWGVLVLMNCQFNMGKSLSLWLLFNLLWATGVAFLAGKAFAPGAPYMSVFGFVAVAAFLGHAGGLMPESIWKGRPWRTAPAALFDAVVYSLLTAGAFGAMWPKH